MTELEYAELRLKAFRTVLDSDRSLTTDEVFALAERLFQFLLQR